MTRRSSSAHSQVHLAPSLCGLGMHIIVPPNPGKTGFSVTSGSFICPGHQTETPPAAQIPLTQAVELKKSQTAPSVVSRHTGPDLEPVAPSGRRVGKRTMHPYIKRARTPLDPSGLRYIRSESIPYPGSNLSHFDGISWNQMAGGRGYPLWVRAHNAEPTTASPSGLSDLRYIRFESIPYPGSNPSHFDGISWNQMAGGRGCPPYWASKPVLCA
jgi:hypothetical protein